MLFGPDGLANFFLFLFLFGLIFTIVTLLLGFAHAGDVHIPHVGGHGHDIHLGGHDGIEGPGVLNLPTIMAFITWFGGVGYLLRQNLDLTAFVVVPIAIVSGLVGGAIMFIILVRVLWPMMTPPLESKDFTLPGTPARVVSSIRSGGVGEIVYTKGGVRFTAGAKGTDDKPISKGAEVVIINYERGLAYVQGVDDLLANEESEQA